MSAPDFYFCVNAIFKHVNDRYGRSVLEEYWKSLGREFYSERVERWRQGGLQAIADDWKTYFAAEPQSKVAVQIIESTVDLDIQVCPAIKHLRDHQRDIVPYFCDHCDHICGAMAEASGYQFTRTGGMGACQQRFTPLTINREN